MREAVSPASASAHRALILDVDRATMKKHGLLASLLALTVLAAACSSSASGPTAPPSASAPAAAPDATASASPAGATQTNEGGGVTVVASWPGPTAGAAFDVKLDTHSVELDALDLTNAVLSNDRGETLAARPWAAPKGGHHREGALTFDGDASTFFAGAKWVELTLAGVGDIPERTMRWAIGS